MIVVNYESWPDVVRLAETLAQAPEIRSGRWEVVVVDNSTRHRVPDCMQPPPAGVRVIVNPRNLGFAAGVNVGCEEARGEWILLLNPDVVLDAGFPEEVDRRIGHYQSRAEGRPGLVGFALRNEDGTPQPSVGIEPSLLQSLRGQFIPRVRRKYQPVSRAVAGSVSWVTGACVLIDAATLRAGNGMDEDFFLYYEEVALCRTVRRLGRSVEFDPAVSVTHLRPLQNRAVSPKLRVITRHSKLVYFQKHRPLIEFRILRRVVLIEAAVRKAWARVSGDFPQGRCWSLVGRIARRMGPGRKVVGRDVIEWAETLDAPRPGVVIHHGHLDQGSHLAAGHRSRSV